MVYFAAMPMNRLHLPLSLALAVSFLSFPSAAQEPSAESSPVALNEEAPKPAPKKKKKQKAKSDAGEQKTGPVAQFVGFRVLPDGTSRVYVDVSGRVQVSKREGENELVYALKGARLASSNNQNALLTTHFKTPVVKARLVPASEDVELVIELRAKASPSHRLLPREGESTQLQVDFPAEDAPSGDEAS